MHVLWVCCIFCCCVVFLCCCVYLFCKFYDEVAVRCVNADLEYVVQQAAAI
jgi:hypothetical protein